MNDSTPDTLGNLRLQVEYLLDVGRAREARGLLRAGLSEAPGDPELRVLAARAARAEGDTTEARLQLEHALQNAPHHFGARLQLYFIEIGSDHWSRAEEVLGGLIRDNPKDATLLALSAQDMFRADQLKGARALVDEALERDPDDKTARITELVLSELEGNTAQVKAKMAALLADDPDDDFLLLLQLMLLSKRGRNWEALRLAKQLILRQPNEPTVLDWLIKLRVQTHPLGLLLYPDQMLGLGSSKQATIAVCGILWLDFEKGFSGLNLACAGYLLWVVYILVYPPLMTRWIRIRGV